MAIPNVHRRGRFQSVADYPTMSLPEVCALPVGDLATPDAMLFLWATSAHLEQAFAVINAWENFAYSSSIVWVKTDRNPGLGHVVRLQHELFLIARRATFRIHRLTPGRLR